MDAVKSVVWQRQRGSQCPVGYCPNKYASFLLLNNIFTREIVNVSSLREIQYHFDQLNLGMGSVMLYHDAGYMVDALTYAISGMQIQFALQQNRSYFILGITRSRFSHMTMILPMPEFPGVPGMFGCTSRVESNCC